jgi:hypothetical protein
MRNGQLSVVTGRYLHKTAVFLAAAALALSASRAAAAVPWPAEITAFIEAKERQAGQLASKLELEVATDIWTFFAAARKADFEAASKLYASLSKSRSSETPKAGACTPLFQTLLEVELILEWYFEGEPAYGTSFGRAVVKSIPAGSIYFGGTDPGRGLPTAFCKSHARGEPFFTLTQNALADGTYLEYLSEMYGKSLYIPTKDDSQHCFEDYMADAQARQKLGQLKPGEDVRVVEGRVQVSGQVAVMAINGLLAKIIFDKNPKREFYLEESFPLDWMYPHLTPHDLILKINREPVAALKTEVLDRDRAFWLAQAKGLIGDWLKPDTTVKQVCAFVEKVFLNKDLAGYQGDPLYPKSEWSGKMYSKLRSSIGGVYAWRLGSCPADYRPKSAPEAERLKQEAEFAFKQAYAFCPQSPEALYRFVNLLLIGGRMDDALLLAKTSLKLVPANAGTKNLVLEIEKMKKARQP